MAGTWTTLDQLPFDVGTMLLLTDGSVMCEVLDGGFGTPNWKKLVPDPSGSYMKPTVFDLAPLPDNHGIPAKFNGPENAPLYFASAVLKDGRVFVAGGEYNRKTANADISAAQIYDPLTNAWMAIAPPPTWSQIGDAPSCLLPDGKLLLGSIDDTKTALYDPVTNTWMAIEGKRYKSSEETWTLLPDGSVITVNCFGPLTTEKYVGAVNAWVSAGKVPDDNDLVDSKTSEIGPAVLLPDGRLFAIGATGKTAFYAMPPVPDQPGTWTAGPSFPQIDGKTLGSTDGAACLLPNGRVLCVAGPVSCNCMNDNDKGYCPPTYFFELDPATTTLTRVDNPSNNPLPPDNPGNPTFIGRMLLLPTGQVLFANTTNSICLYEPDGAPDPSWQPAITACPTALQPGQKYTLQGRQLNGLSQAVSYGDDAQMATNYPLVRLTNPDSGKVYYCRTANHSTMAVATGNAVQSTQFTLPPGVESGTYNLNVVANGIASGPLLVTVTGSQSA